jgi:type IV pilus assembly protein PilX
MNNKKLVSRQQRGASLIVALAFLLIMAMLGVTVANVTGLQERMAGNTRDRDMALQAAEAALRDAETRLTDSTFRSGITVDFDANNANDAAFWDECFLESSPPCDFAPYTPLVELPSEGAGAVAEPPKYVIEKKPPEAGGTQVFRVTTRAVGGTAAAVVVLQAEYAFTP